MNFLPSRYLLLPHSLSHTSLMLMLYFPNSHHCMFQNHMEASFKLTLEATESDMQVVSFCKLATSCVLIFKIVLMNQNFVALLAKISYSQTVVFVNPCSL